MAFKALSFVILVASTVSSAHELGQRDECGKTYTSCNPKGTKTLNPPVAGSGLQSFYNDLVGSVAGIRFHRRTLGEARWVASDSWTPPESEVQRRGTAPICCAEGTQCLLMHDTGLPFCYDKFTTNFFLPDGSYGTISNGSYHGSEGSEANLLTGDYKSDGQSGNIYSGDQAAKPNTASLAIPSQYTGTGVGSAIPITALANIVIYTTVIPTTITDSTTLPETTVEATTIPDRTVSGKAYSGTTIKATTVAALTISGSTTMDHTTRVTSTLAAAVSQATQQNAAASFAGQSSTIVKTLLSLFGVMSFAVCAL